MERLLDKIIEHNLDKEDRKLIYALTGNEKYHYAELETSKLYESEKFFGNMKKIAEAITREKDRNYLQKKFRYRKYKKKAMPISNYVFRNVFLYGSYH